MTKTQTQKEYTDPVCKMAVGEKGPTPPYSLGVCTFHFCSDGCRSLFIAHPEKYLTEKPKKRKGWWGRYLDRLNKTTGGKAQSCCH